jgi:uncharacterized protein YciI
MKTFLYRLEPIRLEMATIGPTPEEAAIVSEHFAHLETLTRQGVLLLVGRTEEGADDVFGIVIFQADSEERARVIMNSDPAVMRGIMRARLFPFRISLHSAWPEEL